MTTPSTKVSRPTSYPAAGPAGLSAGAAGDEKGMSTSTQAISKFTSAIISSPFRPFESGDAEDLQKVLNLEPSMFIERGETAPDFQLNLSDRERALLRQTFEKWTIGTQCNLWEVWSVDFFWRVEKFMDLKGLAGVSKKEWKDPVLNAFLSKFIPYSVSILGAHLKRQNPSTLKDITFFEEGAGSTQFALLQHRRQIVSEIAQIGRIVEKMSARVQEQVKLPAEDLKKLVKDSKEIVERAALMAKLLIHEDATRVLCEFNLSDLQQQFPRAAAMNEGSPQRILTDLIAYAGFVRRSYDAALKDKNISVVITLFKAFEEALKKFPKAGNRLAAVADLKKAMTQLFGELGIKNQSFQDDFNAACDGKLTFEQYIERNKMQVAYKKSPVEFNNSLFFKMSESLVFNETFHNFLDILDRVLSIEYPDIFVPTTVGFARLDVNLNYLVGRESTEFACKTVAPPQMSFLKADLQEELTALLTSMRREVHAASLRDLAWSDAHLHLMDLRLRELSCEKRYYFDAWVIFLATIQSHIITLDKSTLTLEKFLPKHLSEIEKFLRKLLPEDLAAHQEELTNYLEETLFEGCLDFCSFNIIARDMEAALQLNIDLSVLSPTEDKLLRPELERYITLEGIDEIFDRLTASIPKIKSAALESKEGAGAGAAAAVKRPGLPMREDLTEKPPKREPKAGAAASARADAGASAAPVQARATAAAARAQILSLTAASAAEPASSPKERFRSIRGEKFRKLRQRLQGAGLLVTRTRGRHIQMEGKEGKVQLTALAGSGTVKPGTAAAIARRMNSY